MTGVELSRSRLSTPIERTGRQPVAASASATAPSWTLAIIA
jgi:hypothetical protein